MRKLLLLATLVAMFSLAGLQVVRIVEKRAMASSLRHSAAYEPRYARFEIVPNGLATSLNMEAVVGAQRLLALFCEDSEACTESLPTWRTLIREAHGDNVGIVLVSTDRRQWIQGVLGPALDPKEFGIIKISDAAAYGIATGLSVVPTTAVFDAHWYPLRIATGILDAQQLSAIRASMKDGSPGGRVLQAGRNGALWATEKEKQ